MDLEDIITIGITAVNGAMFLSTIGLAYASYKYVHPGKGKNVIAVVPINGTISDKDSLGKVNSKKVIKDIEKLCKNPKIKGIIFDINSGGGSPYQSKEIAEYIRKKVKVPKVAVARSICASGAYMIASATDYIIAGEDSSIGSIGVVGVHLAFGGLLEKLGIKYQIVTSGKHKGMHLPLDKLGVEEEAILKGQSDVIYMSFVNYVAENRFAAYKLESHDPPASDFDSVRDHILSLATGKTYIGPQAFYAGLIDKIGSDDEAIAYLERKGNFEHSGIHEIKNPSSPLSKFGMGVGVSIGTSVAQSLKESLLDDINY